MALNRLFKEWGRQVNQDRTGEKIDRFRELFGEVNNLLDEGEFSEIQRLLDEGHTSMEDIDVYHRQMSELNDIYVPKISKEIEDKYGIKLPPESYLLIVAARLTMEEAGEEGMAAANFLEALARKMRGEPEELTAEGSKAVPDKKKKSRRSQEKRAVGDLTQRQHEYAQAIFRTPESEEGEMSLDDALALVYQEHMQAMSDVNRQALIRQQRDYVNIAKKEVTKKLTEVLTANLGMRADEPVALLGEQLDRLEDQPAIRQLLERISRIEAYQEMTWAELINYTNNNKAIRLRGGIEAERDSDNG
jgi:hypothetical protein